MIERSRRSKNGTKLLVQFTDEELALFGAEHPVVDAPYLSGLDEAQRQLAVQVAYRSLCSHGAVAVNGGTGMELPESVVTMLQVRSSAKVALLISKSTGDIGVLRYHHFGADVVVIEDVTDDGAHQFRLISHDELPDEIDAFCAVDGAADGHGASLTLTADSFASGRLARDLWGEGVAQFDATVWRATSDGSDGQLLLGFLLGTSGSWSSRRVLAPLEGGEQLVQVEPVQARQVGDLIIKELLSEEGTDLIPDEWHLMRT
ncbi:hypothetical protein GCM10011492_33470 [Flexivirga endophytica]|uniref:Uncharacterized protein n=1 Tax=Flexivirga endophytica TaxID=1849103 RepID=A0A916TCE1_9MICO|nr:hypothetical protein [Flexivirga endophytica]GGB39963.1 hypothetical protein GCM10011492_33470 [Flexivirga endophytica]GHB47853.1 hypothetical protein GCM10008112_15860 [Flexivirga endophytica]